MSGPPPVLIYHIKNIVIKVVQTAAGPTVISTKKGMFLYFGGPGGSKDVVQIKFSLSLMLRNNTSLSPYYL